MKKKIFLLLLIMFFLIVSCCCQVKQNDVEFYSKVENLISKKQFEEAIKLLESSKSKDYEYYCLKGKCLINSSESIKIRNANEMLKKAYLYGIKDYEVIELLADSYFKRHFYESALQYYQEAAELCHDDFHCQNIYKKIGEIYFIESDYITAVKYFETADKNPDFDDYFVLLKRMCDIYIKGYKFPQANILFDVLLKVGNQDRLRIVLNSILRYDVNYLSEIVMVGKEKFTPEEILYDLDVYSIFISLYNRNIIEAKRIIDNLSKKTKPDYLFTKYLSFYYWVINDYVKANVQSDFYYFWFHCEENIESVLEEGSEYFYNRFCDDYEFNLLKNSYNN